MQYNPELIHLLKKETIILTQIKRFNFTREERIKKCRLVSFDQELHVVAPDEIKPGDNVVDVAALAVVVVGDVVAAVVFVVFVGGIVSSFFLDALNIIDMSTITLVS